MFLWDRGPVVSEIFVVQKQWSDLFHQVRLQTRTLHQGVNTEPFSPRTPADQNIHNGLNIEAGGWSLESPHTSHGKSVHKNRTKSPAYYPTDRLTDQWEQS